MAHIKLSGTIVVTPYTPAGDGTGAGRSVVSLEALDSAMPKMVLRTTLTPSAAPPSISIASFLPSILEVAVVVEEAAAAMRSSTPTRSACYGIKKEDGV